MRRSNIILLVLIAVLVYIAYVVGPMYYKYQMMVLEVKGQVKVAHMYNDVEIKEHLLASIDEWELPVNPDSILVDMRESDIIISMRYHVDKLFFTKYKRRFRFKIRVKGDIESEDF